MRLSLGVLINWLHLQLHGRCGEVRLCHRGGVFVVINMHGEKVMLMLGVADVLGIDQSLVRSGSIRS